MSEAALDASELASRLFPGLCVCVEIVRPEPGRDDLAALDPRERALVDRAVTKRRVGFGLGRRAAHAALARLGVPAAPLLNGADRAPRWPAGVVGSISHADDIAIAVVADAVAVAGLGVDVEHRAGLDEELWRRILRPAEAAAVCELPTEQRRAQALAVFCAKEAVYKAWYPQGQRVLEFSEVETRFDAARAAFTAQIAPSPHLLAHGRALRATGCSFASAWLSSTG